MIGGGILSLFGGIMVIAMTEASVPEALVFGLILIALGLMMILGTWFSYGKREKNVKELESCHGIKQLISGRQLFMSNNGDVYLASHNEPSAYRYERLACINVQSAHTVTANGTIAALELHYLDHLDNVGTVRIKGAPDAVLTALHKLGYEV